ncbi:type II secretion system F family protein [Permianibacter aggregans]|uniref:Type II secretion system protein F (GspF) n=1 Tax=Permianibacter aggregans TaxID=1510150 RepID=A0A4R6UFD1_9GAMM|nr:type II secretion system F family protein [Permianibacter aggregans]QGX39016.1 type II secretion system F family protein [Permianibacter aggregans]TDQ44646.1 type II secretion system protein F (GspF) [Permianibacter aggregans]
MALQAVKKEVPVKPRPGAITRQKQTVEKQKTYVWIGTDKKGQKLKGEMQASNEALVKAHLRKQGLVPVKVNRKAADLFAPRKKPITASDISLVSRQLATMMKAGVPLVQSFEIIGKGNDKPAVQELMLNIKADVEAGAPFHESLRKHPKEFDPLFCDLVAAGEQSGALEQMLDRIATYKEKTERIKAKIKKALFYPIAVLVVAVIVTAILLLFVVPMFEDMFKSFGADLPAFTQFVLGISRSLQETWYVYLIAIVAASFGFGYLNRTSQKFRDGKERVILKMPVVGMILHKAAIARYARTLSTTFAAGVPLVEALESAAGASGNVVYRNAILKIRDDVTTGTQMNLAMQSSGVFPNMVVQMVAIGEESGSLDSMLSKVADIYEAEVDDAVDSLSALLEPIIMAVLGVVVGGLIIAMYLPIFNLGKAI